MTAQYEALRAQNYDAVTRITAPVSGTFSALVDGYETLIDPDTALQLTPEGLSGLMKQPPEADRTAAGKLITSNQWQFAALVTQEEGERLARESGVTLRFASDFTQDIPMEVVRVGEPENGQAVVVLSTDHCLEQTTLLRARRAELIFDSRSGLRVPKGAVRMIDGTRTDEETGETTQYSTLGVYVVTAGRAEFKPVEILAEGDEFYVVRSVNQEPEGAAGPGTRWSSGAPACTMESCWSSDGRGLPEEQPETEIQKEGAEMSIQEHVNTVKETIAAAARGGGAGPGGDHPVRRHQGADGRYHPSGHRRGDCGVRREPGPGAHRSPGRRRLCRGPGPFHRPPPDQQGQAGSGKGGADPLGGLPAAASGHRQPGGQAWAWCRTSCWRSTSPGRRARGLHPAGGGGAGPPWRRG